MLRYVIKSYKEVKMIGKVFREGTINLIYGESGSGKTISSIMALNEEDIVPILIDFDGNDSPEQNQCKYIHIDGIALMKESNPVLPINRVIIIDTWAVYESTGGKLGFINSLVELGNTVIVVAHTKDFASKSDIPDMPERYVNHFGSKLWLKREYSKKDGYQSNLHIKKSRGYKGPSVLMGWMRLV